MLFRLPYIFLEQELFPVLNSRAISTLVKPRFLSANINSLALGRDSPPHTLSRYCDKLVNKIEHALACP